MIVFFFEYESVKDNLTKYKCLSCNKDYSNKIDEELKKWFMKTFTFSNNDINKFILLLRKRVYSYEYIDDLETFNETTLPENGRHKINNLKWKTLQMQIICMWTEMVTTLK